MSVVSEGAAMASIGKSARRRAIVFCAVFFPAAAASLFYVFTRPPEYRAVARLQISPASVVTQPSDAKDTPTVAADAKSFLTEVQTLTSRPLLHDVLDRLKSDGGLPDLGPDPVASVQQMLRAEPIEGTQIVQLSAVGPEPEFEPRLVNTVAKVYRQHVADAYKSLAASTTGEVGDEIRALDKEVTAKRQAINAFRDRYDIVSMEHKENDVLADIEGLSESYTDANEKLAKAQGHLQALRSSIAAGKAVFRAKDDPTLADLQQRVSVAREQWHDLQRRFTPDYLAMDADAKSLRARLDNLEDQLKAQHGAGERAALAQAQEDVSSAQAEVERLRKNVADNQKQAQEFATHLNEYKTMREDLDHLEGMHRAALDRLTKLQASERERAPHAESLEAAAPSDAPWRPDYRFDALIAVGGSLGLGLFAAWFADFIAGPAPLPAAVVQHQHSWAPGLLARETPPPELLSAPEIGLLPAPQRPPRELADREIGALVAATTEDARLVVVGLLMGLTAEELAALRWDQINLPGGMIRLDGEGARSMPLAEPLQGLVAARRRQQPEAEGAVLRRADGEPLAADEIGRLVLFGAYDAALDQPHEVTAQALRYTYLSFLLRQGVRAADIGRIAGPIPQQELLAYMQLHSPAARRPIDEIERVLPALREHAESGTG
jgi:uncharacterized protein involved in exopolysaccharide biosynthesis